MTNPLDNIPEIEPAEVVAGDTWTWKRGGLSGDYPPAAYGLTYALKLEGSANAPSIITAAEQGNNYIVTVAAATTGAYAAGVWRWDAFMTRTSDGARVHIGTGQLIVLANRAVATGDPRSHAQRMLAAIDALLEGRAVKDVNSYSIKDRSLTKMTAAELMEWRDYYRREVNRQKIAERASQGKATGRTSVVRFGS